VVLKQNKDAGKNTNTIPTVAATNPASGTAPAATARLPKLRDLGAGKCIPCKAMAPILEELKKEYAGRMDVEFIDVWQNPDAGKAFNVEMIPTQIFYDAEGREIFRHTGFYGKEDILGKWKELGVELAAKTEGGN
jgi:thioredoxin 1